MARGFGLLALLRLAGLFCLAQGNAGEQLAAGGGGCRFDWEARPYLPARRARSEEPVRPPCPERSLGAAAGRAACPPLDLLAPTPSVPNHQQRSCVVSRCTSPALPPVNPPLPTEEHPDDNDAVAGRALLGGAVAQAGEQGGTALPAQICTLII